MNQAMRGRSFLAVLVAAAGLAATPASGATYTNPLQVDIPGDGRVESCADPSIVKGRGADARFWFAYCTTDPLNGADRDSSGKLRFHLIPVLRSSDLVHWRYLGDAFAARPAWVGDTAGLWAPEIKFFDGRYYLYYTAPETKLPRDGSAIGVGTSASPAGPFADSGSPVVEPHAPPCCAADIRWTFDPAVVEDGAQKYIFYGSYFGGISARRLSADGLHSDPATQTQITSANRYEGAYVVRHGGFFYLFASATDCCRGPLTGYSVFAGRSASILGPYVDREGSSLLAARVGGTPVISMNGNRWVGTGHNAVFSDARGQTWLLYHAVDRNDAYFAGEVGFTKRPVLMDRLDWIGGWPTVRGGLWASDSPQPTPALTARDRKQKVVRVREPKLGPVAAGFSDEFGGPLGPPWTWVRTPAATVDAGALRFPTQAADLYVDSNDASVLTRPAPAYDYAIETRVSLDVPAEGCCFNFTQAGLVVYGDDDNYVKLAHVSIFDTRQTEFGKELKPVPAGFPRYGNTVVGPPADWTYLRITSRRSGAQTLYTAYTSGDGRRWVRGGTWTHTLPDARLGLVSMGGSGFTARFDWVRVYPIR
jgi:arabinan endo-1,5-alpha-L-arabinosidase